jgi:hypothetical protein
MSPGKRRFAKAVPRGGRDNMRAHGWPRGTAPSGRGRDTKSRVVFELRGICYHYNVRLLTFPIHLHSLISLDTCRLLILIYTTPCWMRCSSTLLEPNCICGRFETQYALSSRHTHDHIYTSPCFIFPYCDGIQLQNILRAVNMMHSQTFPIRKTGVALVCIKSPLM